MDGIKTILEVITELKGLGQPGRDNGQLSLDEYCKSASATFRIHYSKHYHLLFRALLFSFTFLTAATADRYFSSIAVFMADNTGTSHSRSVPKIKTFIDDTELQDGPLNW